jgi:tetratricopeptide (TPR) repeat protein
MTHLRPTAVLALAGLACGLLSACAGTASRDARGQGPSAGVVATNEDEPSIPSANLSQLQADADRAYQEGRMLDAEQIYQRLLRAVPTSSQAWFRLGNVHLRSDRLEAAEYAYRECLKHAPRDMRCWQNLSLTYVEMSVATLEQAQSASQDEATRERLDGFRRRLIESVGTATEEVR